MSLFEDSEYVDIKAVVEKEKKKKENVLLLENVTTQKIDIEFEAEATPTKQTIQTPKSYIHLLKPEDGCKMTLSSWAIVSLYAGWYMIILYISVQQFIISILPPTLTILPFMIWWYSNRDKCPLYEVICCYADGMNAFTMSAVILHILDKLCYFFGITFGPTSTFAVFMSVMSMAIVGELLKALMYHLNSTHEDLYKPKRAVIVSLIISMGFAFGESLSIISIIWYAAPNLELGQELVVFSLTAFILGTPLHMFCGYLSGILNTLDDNNHFESCAYTIPARALYMFGECKLLLDPSLNLAILATIGSSGAIIFLIYCIDSFSNSIPEIADHSYMSLLAYAEFNSDSEEEKENPQV